MIVSSPANQSSATPPSAPDRTSGAQQGTEPLLDDLQNALSLAGVGVWSLHVDEDRLQVCPVLRDAYGLDEEAATTAAFFTSVAHPAGTIDLGVVLEQCAARQKAFDVKIRQMIHGQDRWVRFSGSPVVEGGVVTRIRGCWRDLTEEVRTRRDFMRLASRDHLTDVANRASFVSLFEEMVRSIDFEAQALFLFVIDIDHFKQINDNFGHDVGDRVLREVSRILLGAVRAGDVVGRLGGDEFGLIVSGPRAGEVGAMVAERIQATTRAREDLRKIGGGVTLSIGFAEAPGPSASFKKTLKAADLALYDAKRAGRDRSTQYHQTMGAVYERREKVLVEVADGLQRDEFEPRYQLKVSLADGAVAGFEALARWRHPEMGLQEPEFFDEALRNQRLATEISNAVLRQVVRDAGDLRRQGLGFGRIAVNVTEKQLADPSFAPRLSTLCEEHGALCTDLELEITEDVLLARHLRGVRRSMTALHDLGVRLTLDDFGTGYVSLTHLRKFPIDNVKIDQRFVTDVDLDSDRRVIVGAVIRMARDLGLGTVAEGVETEGAARLLRELGCDMAQGYLYGRPEPIERASAVVAPGEKGVLPP